MCFTELLDELAHRGIYFTEMQVRWAIRTRKIDRPPKDESGRYVYGPKQLRQLQKLHEQRQVAR